MVQPILHKEYQLLKCLSEQSQSRTYLATNARGQRFVVKFILDPDLFFEEMARYYACDGSPHLCRLVYNFPAYEICGQPYFFDRDILALFGEESLINPDGSITRPVDSPMARMGALVFEFVEGEPLLHLLPKLADNRKLGYLHELAKALEDLHENGEFHGNLCPGNVLVEAGTDRVRLVGMSHGPGPDGQSSGCAGDVRAFALHYLNAIEDPGPNLLNLHKACLHANPARRPAIPKVRRKLEFNKKLSLMGIEWSAKACTLAVATLLLCLLCIVAGHYSLSSPFFPSWIHATSQPADRQTIGMVVCPDAVFSLQNKRLLLLDGVIYATNDPVRHRDESLTLSEINWDSLILASPSNRRIRIPFGRAGASPRPQSESGVVIWAKTDTLPHVLAAMPQIEARLREPFLASQTSPLARSLATNPRSIEGSGMICGTYEVSSLKGFFELLEKQVRVTQLSGHLRVEPLPERFLHYVFKRVYFEDSTIGDFRDFFESRTGVRLAISDALSASPLRNLNLTEVDWESLLKECGFNWNVDKQKDPFAIYISGMGDMPPSGAG